MVKDRLCCPWCGHRLECSPVSVEALIVCSLCRCRFPITDAIPFSTIEEGYISRLKHLLVQYDYLFRKIPRVPLLRNKLELIDTAFRKEEIHSFADFGGVWNVHGGYTFYILNKYEISQAYLVDTFFTDIVIKFAKKYPQCKLIKGDIRDPSIVNEIDNVDLIIFFDVLLHEINWKEILSFCSHKANSIVVYQPQYLGERTVRLIELGAEKYFDLLPDVTMYKIYKYLFTEKHKMVEDSPAIWQMGITDDDLIETMNALGHRVIYTIEGGYWKNPKFQSKGFIFKK